MLRVAIIGRTEILIETVNLLIDKGFEIPLIITSKEAPEYKAGMEDFKKLAQRINAGFICTSKISSPEVITILKNSAPLDLGISLNYSGIIPQNIIDYFRIGILNAHGGDLPKYRGNACQAWAIINGEEKMGLCVHKMIGDELDNGNIISRDYFPLNINTKITECWEWMSEKIPVLFLDAAYKLKQDPEYFLEIQSTMKEDALRCYPRLPEDGKISWKLSNLEILRLINASNKPYAGAFCNFNNKKLIIWDAEIQNSDEDYCAVEGQISNINKDGSVSVICGDGLLKINRAEIEGIMENPNIWIKSIRTRLC